MREVGEGGCFQPRGSAAERSQRHRLQDERHSRGGKAQGAGGSIGHTNSKSGKVGSG